MNPVVAAFVPQDTTCMKSPVTVRFYRSRCESLAPQPPVPQTYPFQVSPDGKFRLKLDNRSFLPKPISERLIEQIRESSVNVLITGESGTGKELMAHAIHFSSARARGPFVALNCAALPESLVESELFGVEKGVATGVEPRIGKIETANRGTLFLDEIGDLSLTAQAKILRVLQEKVVDRVGSRQPRQIEVTVVAATNKNLEKEIAEGNFREDLYYRLRVIHIGTPSLAEVRRDIPLLAEHFLTEHSRAMKKRRIRFSSAAMESLQRAPWPGNVRQLQNEIKRLVVCLRGNVIRVEDLAEEFRGGWPEEAGSAARPSDSLSRAVEDLEARLIREALAASGQNHSKLPGSWG